MLNVILSLTHLQICLHQKELLFGRRGIASYLRWSEASFCFHAFYDGVLLHFHFSYFLIKIVEIECSHTCGSSWKVP